MCTLVVFMAVEPERVPKTTPKPQNNPKNSLPTHRSEENDKNLTLIQT